MSTDDWGNPVLSKLEQRNDAERAFNAHLQHLHSTEPDFQANQEQKEKANLIDMINNKLAQIKT